MNNAGQQHQQRPLGVVRTLLALSLPAIAGLLVMALVMPFHRQRGRNLAIRLVSRMALAVCRVKLDISDPAHLLSRRPAIFTVNHESALDPLLVAAALQHDVAPVVKSELRHQFPIGWMLAAAGAVFVDRNGTGSAALAPAARALENGQAIALAPQGTRSQDIVPGSFRPGAIRLAHDTGTPLVMLFLCDAGARMPTHQWRIFPGTVQLKVIGELSAHDASLEKLEQHYLLTQARGGKP